ncbi:uncharacterized protein LOC142771248 [Rhipicephalus microplus]|uniref:uncharacterized protein LOC142771248 n=1 Tax=Rhipicephalus microplus TaxID=6941 RepID=UPI003F6AD71A
MSLSVDRRGSRSELPYLDSQRWQPVLLIFLLICVHGSLTEDEVDFRKPVQHTASATCPEKMPVWQCVRLTWSAPPCRTNFDCAMPFPCCVTWCRNFCANDFRA